MLIYFIFQSLNKVNLHKTSPDFIFIEIICLHQHIQILPVINSIFTQIILNHF